MFSFIQERSRSKFFNYLIVIAVGLWGYASQELSSKKTTWFEALIIDAVSPMQMGVTRAQRHLSNFLEHYIFLIGASRKNVELKKEIAQLRQELFSLREIKLENDRLKQLLKFGQVIPREQVLAQVIGWDSSNSFKVLRVNKGKKDGIELYAPVVTMNGLVGYVYRVSEDFADVLTILDQNNRVDGIVSRTRSHGIAEGYSGLTMTYKYVTRSAPVEIGDVVITAGLGEIYPKGIRVGEVSYVRQDGHEMTQYVELNPSVNFHRLEEVIVLTKRLVPQRGEVMEEGSKGQGE